MHEQLFRLLVIAMISFLTLVDLFATQALLPALAQSYGVKPAVIGPAVNACTLGMALAGVAVAWFNQKLDRRLGVSICLFLLAVPTAALALMPDLTTFAILRIVQGVFMSAAFSLTIAYLADNCTPEEAAGALAAYIAGNVASNLFGRLISAAVASHFGLGSNFGFFAALNIAGACLAYVALKRTPPMKGTVTGSSAAWAQVFRRPELVSCFMIGFIILFSFIGTFTYVNFVLTDRIGISMMQLGLVYLVFLPAIVTTPLAGRTAKRFGARNTVLAALATASAGLPLLAAPHLLPMLVGLTLVGAGTFFAQATATGFASRTAGPNGGAAGGIYLAFYYAGGLFGSLMIGYAFDHAGWNAALAVIGLAFFVAMALASRLTERAAFFNKAAISN
ncbi:MAG: MFS transporter [Rhodospirillales bacterium]|nr:MFS transporter [Rhodospirillales bacterium]